MWKWIATASIVFVCSTHAQQSKEPKKKTRRATDCETSLTENSLHDLDVIQARVFAESLDFEKIKTYLKVLTGETPMPGGFRLDQRYGAAARAITRMTLMHYLRSFGHQPEFEVFEDGANIVVEIPGSLLKDEIVELGAHFDSAGSHVPGADDNGSGLALLLHLAEILPGQHPVRTVRLVFYDMEERECEGSCHHVERLVNDPRHVVGTLIVDMIGYVPPSAKTWLMVAEIGKSPLYELPEDAKEHDRHKRELRERNHAFAREIFYYTRRLPGLGKVELSAETEESRPESGDHGSYWDSYKNAVFFAAPAEGRYVNPDNHGSGDTIKNMNWDYYKDAAKIFAGVAAYMARVPVDEETKGGKIAKALLKKEDLKFTKAEGGQTLPPALAREPDLIKKVEPSFSSSSSSGIGFGFGAIAPRFSPKERELYQEFKDRFGMELNELQASRLLNIRRLPVSQRLLILSKDGRAATFLGNSNFDDFTTYIDDTIKALVFEFSKEGGGGKFMQLDGNPSELTHSFKDKAHDWATDADSPNGVAENTFDNSLKSLKVTLYPKITDDVVTKILGSSKPAQSVKIEVASISKPPPTNVTTAPNHIITKFEVNRLVQNVQLREGKTLSESEAAVFLQIQQMDRRFLLVDKTGLPVGVAIPEMTFVQERSEAFYDLIVREFADHGGSAVVINWEKGPIPSELALKLGALIFSSEPGQQSLNLFLKSKETTITYYKDISIDFLRTQKANYGALEKAKPDSDQSSLLQRHFKDSFGIDLEERQVLPLSQVLAAPLPKRLLVFKMGSGNLFLFGEGQYFRLDGSALETHFLKDFERYGGSLIVIERSMNSPGEPSPFNKVLSNATRPEIFKDRPGFKYYDEVTPALIKLLRPNHSLVDPGELN